MNAAAHGLSAETVAEIIAIFDRFPQVEGALLFGSRAKGVHRAGSDIDLALQGAEIDPRTLGQIEDALEDSFLPYRFSLVILHRLNDPDLRAHIQRVQKVFYERPSLRALPAGD